MASIRQKLGQKLTKMLITNKAYRNNKEFPHENIWLF